MTESQPDSKLKPTPRVKTEDDPHYHDEEPDIVQDEKHPPRGLTTDLPKAKRRLPPPRRRFEDG